MSRKAFLRRHVLVIGLAVAAAAIYVPSLGNSFVYDDTINIVKNPSIRRLANAPRFFTEAETATSNESFEAVYRPLSTLSYALDYAIGDLRPSGYILHNVVLHALATALCVATFRALTGSAWLAAASGVAFALHPIQTEPVNWATGRATLLYALFYLLAVRLYVAAALRSGAAREAEDGRRAALLWTLSWLAGAAALLSKEMAVTLPASLLLVEWLLPPDPAARWKRRLVRVAPTLALTAAYLAARAAALGGRTTREEYWGGSPWKTAQVMGKVMARYAQLLVFPAGQNIEHSVSIPETWWDLPSLAGFLLVAAAAGAALWLTRRRLVLAFGLLWIGVELAPVSNLIPFYGLIAERHLYLVVAGFGLALGDAAAWLGGATAPQPPGGAPGAAMPASTPAAGLAARRRRRLAGAALAVLGVVYASASLVRSRVWSDEVALWQDTVAKSPSKVKAHNNLGLAYLRRDRVDEAVEEFRKALAIYPRSAGAHANLGLVYLQRNELSRALEELRQAVEENPHNLDAHKHLATAYLRLAQWADAERVARQALAVRDDPDIRYLLGASLLKQGRGAQAEAEFARVLERDPQQPDALRQMGLLRQRQGRGDEAREYYRRALAAGPAPDLLFNLGLLDLEREDYAAAAAEFAGARALAPQVPEAALRQAQAEIFRDLTGRVRPEILRGMRTEAVREHAADARLLRALPDAAGIAALLAPARELRTVPSVHAAIVSTLALLARAQGKLGEARSLYEDLLASSDDAASAHLAIGEMAAQGGDNALAEEHLRRAVALDPSLAPAYARLGSLARLRGDPASALALYSRALAVSTGYEPAFEGRCETLYDLERWSAAQRCFEELVRARPDHPRAHEYLGRLYRRAGDAARARAEFERHDEIRRRQGSAADTAASIE